MPRKRPSGDDLRTQRAREEMIEGPSAVDLDVHDFSVKVQARPSSAEQRLGIYRRSCGWWCWPVTRLETQPYGLRRGYHPRYGQSQDRRRPHPRASLRSRGLRAPHVQSQGRGHGQEPFEAGGDTSPAQMVGLPRPPFAPRHRLHGHPELGATAPPSISTRSWIWPRPPTTGPRMRSSVGTWKPTGHCYTG